MSIYRRGASGFRDMTQAPDKDRIKSATCYITALQFLGELMRFIPYKGTTPEQRVSTVMARRGPDTFVPVPKARFLMQLVVKVCFEPDICQ